MKIGTILLKHSKPLYKDCRGFASGSLSEMDIRTKNVDPHYFRNILEKLRNRVNFKKSSLSAWNASLGISNIEYSRKDSNKNNRKINNNNNNNYNMLVDGIHIDRYSDDDDVYDMNGNITYSNNLFVFKTDTDINVGIPSLGVYPISPEIELPILNAPCPTPTCQQFSNLPEFVTISPLFNTPPSSPVKQSTPVKSQKKFFSSSLKYGSSPAPIIQPAKGNNSSSCSPALTVKTLSVLPDISKTSLSLYNDLSFSTSHADSHDQGYSSDDSMMDITFMPPLDDKPGMDVFVNDIKDLGINDKPKFRLPVSVCDEVSEAEYQTVKKTSNKHNNLLYKFVLSLLNDPNANPKLLKWEDRENGVFRFVQSENVAKLWGVRKNNPVMTYEKLSRAMRFCRKAGYFESVPKTGRFPKKLCFMFGQKAQGWKD